MVLTAFISPFQEDRAQVREILEGNEFLEVYVECPLEECEKRDPKGLYKKARSGEIRDFTGIDSPYESPANPELTINTSTQSVEECVQTVIAYLANRKFI
ncbi:Adenylyl-sulfate kinase [Streptococcus pneumoniae]|nr:Adenylyl-sulfate kinase [Streptococcus pneumoniae]